MGDAGLILGGPILRETLAAGTIIFAVCATGSQMLAGQITLDLLSGNRLCLTLATGKIDPVKLKRIQVVTNRLVSQEFSLYQLCFFPSHEPLIDYPGSLSLHVSAC